MRYRILDQADAELEWAAGHAELQNRGRGYRLLRAYRDVVEWATTFPHSGSPFRDLDTTLEVRAFRLGRFDYTVVVAVLPDEVVAIAVAHESREPGYWRERLKQA